MVHFVFKLRSILCLNCKSFGFVNIGLTSFLAKFDLLDAQRRFHFTCLLRGHPLLLCGRRKAALKKSFTSYTFLMYLSKQLLYTVFSDLLWELATRSIFTFFVLLAVHRFVLMCFLRCLVSIA